MTSEPLGREAERATLDAAVLEKYGLRWAVLGAWRDALKLRSVGVPNEVDLMLDSARIKIASGCFSVCAVGCDLSQIEAALTTADSSTSHNWVDFWLDLLGHSMAESVDPGRILKIPAIKARYQNCGLTVCRC